MTCRCGHGRQTHRRGSGRKLLPCWAPLPAGMVETNRRHYCPCRNWHPKETKR